jgi:2-polyprenyl-6-methoxyphenol hydroxylase-like FAD-dependent oxidoreductase
MDVVVVGAGPAGSFLAIAWARRGHPVIVVDRAAPPGPDGAWPDRGVQQFQQPHGFRPQVADALAAEMPDVLGALKAAGAELVPGTYALTGLAHLTIKLRRSRLDPVLWRALAAEPGVTMTTATVHGIRSGRGGRLSVLTTAGDISADLVVNATGRTRGFADTLRAPAERVDSAMTYVSRQYQLLPGARAHLPESIDGRWSHLGFGAVVFEHEADVITVLIERPTGDRGLFRLREQAGFEAAVAAVEPLAARTDPRHVRPCSPVRPGGRLQSHYRGQLTANAEVALPGLLHVGDAMCSPSPSLGRGTATSLMQARKLLELVDHGGALVDVTHAFHEWCHERIRPWFVDQGRDDLVSLRLRRAGDVDLGVPPASSLILEANADDTRVRALLDAYAEMEVLPSALEPLIPRTRERLRRGWRPAINPGPDAAELARVIAKAAG